MQRNRNETVTERFTIPVLLTPLRGEKEDGFATFQRELHIGPVRIFGNDDLKSALRTMHPHEVKHFYAATMLRKALGVSPDPLAIQKGTELMNEAYALKNKFEGPALEPFPEPQNPQRERTNFGRALAKLMGLPQEQTEEALQIFEERKPGPRASGDPRWLLSSEISKALEKARLVLWWTGETFKTAIWCPDQKTALYACALLGMFRICPHCSGPFFPDRPDQHYCSPAHREAHRVARWRATKASKPSSRKPDRKERKNGSRKTR